MRNEPATTRLPGVAKDEASHAVEFACDVEAVQFQEGLEVDTSPDGIPQHTGIANKHRRPAPTPASF